jgi:hypothetical protein
MKKEPEGRQLVFFDNKKTHKDVADAAHVMVALLRGEVREITQLLEDIDRLATSLASSDVADHESSVDGSVFDSVGDIGRTALYGVVQELRRAWDTMRH